MKKALALALSLLMVFSMFGVMAFAEGENEEGLVNIKFVVDGVVISEVQVQSGIDLAPYTPDNPDKAETETTRYTFKGWRSSADGEIYYKSTIPTPDGTVAEITFTAEYMEEDLSERQSLWNFIESLFERLNLLFEYFATIFNW